MRVLIADDEPLARLRLRDLIEDAGEHEVVAEAGNGREALELGERCDAELVLLDIRMPGMDGLEAARHFAQLARPPAVIFTTAYREHALRAFETGAVDYLLKPVRRERLADALGRASVLNRAQLAQLAEDASPGDSRACVSATVNGKLALVPVTEVRYFRADQKYVTARHADGELLISDSLAALESEFEGRFMRIHRSALAARRWLRGIERTEAGQFAVVFDGVEERLEVSRRLLPAVREVLKEAGAAPG